MNEYPKISIVTPSYNQGDYLEETILSVINQNYPNLEYIIIDGGSTDNSIEIIKKYENDLTYWVSEPDKGMYHAIQKGFDKSTGDIMSWINSDDIYSKGAFSIAIQIFTDYKEVEWITGNTANIDEKSRIINTVSSKSWHKYDYLFGNYKYIQQEGTYWRRTLWEKAGAKLDLNYSLAADMELWSRFFIHGNLHSVNAILGFFRLRSENQKTLEHINKYYEEAEYIIQNYLPNQEKNMLLKLKKKVQVPLIWRFYSDKFNTLCKCEKKINYDRNMKKFIL